MTRLLSFGSYLDTLAAHGWVIATFVAWLGLAVGSFLNVVIYRVPVMLDRHWKGSARELLELPEQNHDARFDLIVPASRCPACATPIRPVHNVPVISWLWLRGRCAACHAKISVRYPAIELFTALCTLTVVAAFGYTWIAVAALGFTWALIAAAFIDYDTTLLPDGITVPLLWAGLLVNLTGAFVDLRSALIGAVVGYLLLWSVYWAFKLLTKKEGMGYGDFKLLAALGAWLGWQALPIVILLSSVIGVVIGGALLAIRRESRPIPFGPFLAFAGFVTLLGRDTFVPLIIR